MAARKSCTWGPRRNGRCPSRSKALGGASKPGKRPSSRRVFRKFEESRGKWHHSTDFTIPEFVRDNAHDAWVIEEFVPKFRKMRVRETWIYNGGAGGNDKFVRVK